MFDRKLLTKLFAFLAMAMALIALSSLAETKIQAQVQKETGVIINGNRVTAKQGFELRRVGKRVFVRKIGSIKDLLEVECSCPVELIQEPGTDSCNKQFDGREFICVPSGNCRCQVHLIPAA